MNRQQPKTARVREHARWQELVDAPHGAKRAAAIRSVARDLGLTVDDVRNALRSVTGIRGRPTAPRCSHCGTQTRHAPTPIAVPCFGEIPGRIDRIKALREWVREAPRAITGDEAISVIDYALAIATGTDSDGKRLSPIDVMRLVTEDAFDR